MDSGSMSVFDEVAGAQLFTLTAKDGAACDRFGISVAVNVNGGSGGGLLQRGR